jgi:hypothetical protein
MIYVKSFLAGLLAIVLAAVLFGITSIFVMKFMGGKSRQSSHFISINFGSPFLWIVWLGAFGVGFYWEYHRLMNR